MDGLCPSIIRHYYTMDIDNKVVFQSGYGQSKMHTRELFAVMHEMYQSICCMCVNVVSISRSAITIAIYQNTRVSCLYSVMAI